MIRRILLFIVVICACPRLSTANAAMAIDLGSEFLKMALIKPGVPMETVLNRDSQRKTPMALAIRDGERFLGDAARKKAHGAAARHTFTFFLDLVGKQMDDPIVAAFQAEFPHLTLTAHPTRGTVQFETGAGGNMSVECALGMILGNARQEVESYAGQQVRNAVITVPSYFGLLERAAVEAAAKIADLNVLQLLGSGAAAALNYGVFRTKEVTEQPQTLLIYDVGSTKTLVTIVRFSLYNETVEGENITNNKSNTNIPQAETIGVGYDRQLGGHHLTLRLLDRLVTEFKKQNPNLGNVTTSPQAMAKLLKEADRVKQVLSANVACFAQVESVFEDRDFRVKVTRDELETMFHDFEQRYLDPINVALRVAQLTMEQLDRVVLMGAGTRVPRLQTILAAFFQGKEIGRLLNTDEAIALGAVYQAARLSKRFIVKRFEVKDLLPENVEAMEQEHSKKAVMGEEEIKEAKRILHEFERKERVKTEYALALNLLESAAYDYSAKMEEDAFSSFGTEDEQQRIREQLAKMKEWLDDMPDETDVEQLKQKRRDLVAPIRKLKNRMRQKKDRPELMDKFAKTLDEADKKLKLFSTGSKEWFNEGELDAYQRTIEVTKAWLDGAKREVEQLKDNQDATFTTDDLKTKANSIIGEMRSLTSKYNTAALKQREEIEAVARKAKEEAEKLEAEAKKEAEGAEEGAKIEGAEEGAKIEGAEEGAKIEEAEAKEAKRAEEL